PHSRPPAGRPLVAVPSAPGGVAGVRHRGDGGPAERQLNRRGQPPKHLPPTSSPSAEESTMLSARNQFNGVVKSVKLGDVMAEVVIQGGALEFVWAITRTSAESMGLKAGDQVKAVIKSTEVMVDKP